MQLINKNFIKKVFLMFLFINSFQLGFSQTQIHKAIYFRTNSSKLDSKSLIVLNDAVKECISDSISFIKIFGYADRVGDSSYNEKLSEQRANAVYNYLKARCTIDTTKVYVEWLGESSDGYDLHFPEAHLQQRCADILISFRRRTN